jgi:6-phosphofructokinase
MKIAVNTGGGDAPGLNAVIRGVVLAANQKGWEVYGIKYGYMGLIDTKQIIRLTPEYVWDITDVGGTILCRKRQPFSISYARSRWESGRGGHIRQSSIEFPGPGV